jgi:hypothetical protein
MCSVDAPALGAILWPNGEVTVITSACMGKEYREFSGKRTLASGIGCDFTPETGVKPFLA